MGWKDWIGKRIYVVLTNHRKYSGKVIEVADVGDGLVFFTIIDKFGKQVVFNSKELEVIQEEA